MANTASDQNDAAQAGREMLSAAHILLSSERIANEEELLVSTCAEVLATGPASLDVVHGAVSGIWPGARLTKERIEAVLARAAESGLVATQETLVGIDWALTRVGLAEIEATRAWYSDALNRLAAQIQERATQDFGGVSGEQADLWAATLVQVFSEAITASPESYSGAISRAASGNVRPVSLNGTRMLQSIQNLSAPPGTKDFLGACLLAAVDGSDPFGNEIVNYVATSCVLHSIVAGRSRAASLTTLGSLTEQRVVLDTPVLVAYLGIKDDADRLETVIRLARDAGMEVIAPQHVLDELDDVIDRVESQVIPGLMEALQGGVSSRVYAASVDEQVLELFLEAAAAGQYRRWQDFADRARNLGAELSVLGVDIRDHGNSQRHNVEQLLNRLKVEVEKTPNHRGAKQVARDAESMEMVWRARRRASRDKASLWPGGWLITYDRKIDPAYRKANTQDSEPMVLTPGQWATLVTETAAAPEVRDLIEAAASFLRQEAVLRIAVKYPPDVALKLARTLEQGGASETDFRVAQLTLVDLLDGASGQTIHSGESISTFVASKRSSRMAAGAATQRQAFESERRRMTQTVSRSAAELSVESRAREAAERASADSEAKIEALQAEKVQAEKDRVEYVALNGRRTVRVAVVVAAVIAAGLLFVLGLPGFGVGTLVGLFIFLNQAREWAADRSVGSARLLVALIPELFGIWDVARRL